MRVLEVAFALNNVACQLVVDVVELSSEEHPQALELLVDTGVYDLEQSAQQLGISRSLDEGLGDEEHYTRLLVLVDLVLEVIAEVKCHFESLASPCYVLALRIMFVLLRCDLEMAVCH